jgi:virulence-associated protein VapD
MFQLVKRLSVYKPSNALPVHNSKQELANRFSKYFDKKIRNIRVALDLSVNTTTASVRAERACDSSFTNFTTLSCDDVLNIIKTSRVKTCSLDPLPACLVKDHIQDLLPSITSIVNSSLQSGLFPSSLKQALVTPLLKKANLDVEDLKNFRPVSNLPFLGKVIERAAISQLQGYINDNDLHNRTQSAYRKFHSVETAIVRVTNDLLNAVDDHGEAILILLDLSAAFDTVDHSILLHRLRVRYGVSGSTYHWFESYLKNRKKSVVIDGTSSDPTNLDWGVPQGSVVGPEMFVIYSAPIEDIIKEHGFSSVSYADDTQLYVLIKPSDRNKAIDHLSKCIEDIRIWMTENKLMLNDAKTELLHVRSKFAKNVSSANITIR